MTKLVCAISSVTTVRIRFTIFSKRETVFFKEISCAEVEVTQAYVQTSFRLIIVQKKDSIDCISGYFRYPNSQINDAFKSVLKSKTNCCQ